MGIRLGFAGTIHGMTPAQLAAFLAFVEAHDIAEFRTGGCVGSDQQATEIICVHTAARVVVCRQRVAAIESPLVLAVAAEKTLTSRKGATRNRAVVDLSDVVVLAPKSAMRFGGTFRTWKYARWAGKRVILLWPDGSVEDRQYRPPTAKPATAPTAATA